MKCPYCLENIDDSARACRFCARDVSLVGPLFQRVENLEVAVARLTDSLALLSSRSPTHAWSPRLSRMTIWRFAVIVGATVVLLIQIWQLLQDLHIYGPEDQIILSLILAFVSIAIGYTHPLSLAAFVLGAVLQSALAALLWNPMINHHVFGWEHTWKESLSDFLTGHWGFWVGFGFAVFSPFLFFSGAWLGKGVRSLVDGKYAPSEASVSLAANLVRQGPKESDDAFDRRVKRVSSVISAIAPVLALIGAIVGAALGRR